MSTEKNEHPQGARAAAFNAAERSNLREGLPASSPFAKAVEAKVIQGDMSFSQAIDALGKHYRQPR